jgi:hypothetical protein
MLYEILLFLWDIAFHFPRCPGMKTHLGSEIAEPGTCFVGLPFACIVVIFKRV